MRTATAVRLLLWLTAARIAAVPVVMVLVLAWTDDPAVMAVAAALFAVAALTDFVDGHLARKWEATTTLGAFLDTTADKLLVTGVLVALVEIGHVWSWAAVVIIGRE
ncbi:MAG: CDP-alcohol phosphatidyltransferase family protein, partial [Egibacteraceae bacterium]